MIKKIGIVILLFSYIYQINYFFLPFNTPFILGFLGLPLYIYRNCTICSKDRVFVKDILLSFWPVAIVALFSILLNLSFDFYFVKWAIINTFYFFGSYLLVQLLIHSFKDFSFGKLVELLVLCAIVQLSLSITMYFVPEVGNVLQSLIHESDIAKDAILRTEGTRLIGFGTHFFISGTVHAFILIMIAFYFMFEKVSYSQSVMLILSFIFITVIGMMMARTTVLGVLFAIVIILFMRKGKNYFIYGLVFSVIMLYMSSSYLDSFVVDMDTLIQFGYQPFLNYQETGSLSTHSTESMFSMYIFPSTFETWLLGDGLYSVGKGYYMNTDIGYCRLLFYFGVIGLVTYFYFEYFILKRIFPPQKYGNIVWSLLFCFVLALNGKGTFDIFPYVCLFGFCIYPCKPNTKRL